MLFLTFILPKNNGIKIRYKCATEMVVLTINK